MPLVRTKMGHLMLCYAMLGYSRHYQCLAYFILYLNISKYDICALLQHRLLKLFQQSNTSEAYARDAHSVTY